MLRLPLKLLARWVLAFVTCTMGTLAAAQTLPPARLDLNVDRVVSPLDAFELRKCLNKAAGCDPRADFDDDGTITVRDLSLLSRSYGRTAPPPTTSILSTNLVASVSKSVVRPGESFTLNVEPRGFAGPAPRIRWYLPGDVVVEGSSVTRSLSTPGVVPIGVVARFSDGTVVETGLTVTVTETSGQAPASLRLPPRPGDIDNSGAVDLIDAYRLYRQLAGVSNRLDLAARNVADIDRDGKLTNLDAEQIALAAISGSPWFETASPRLMKPGTIVTLRSAAFVAPSAEVTVRVSGSSIVQRPVSIVPGIATFQMPYDVVANGSPATITVFDGAVQRAQFLVRIQPLPAPVADPQALVIELLTLVKQALANNTQRVDERAVSAGLQPADRDTLRNVALGGERQGAVELDTLIRILSGPGGRRTAQVFAAALQANGFEDLQATLQELRDAVANPGPTPRAALPGLAVGRQLSSAANTACDIALGSFCPLKTIGDALSTASTITQVGCTALLAGIGAAIAFPGDGPLIDVVTLTLWVSACSKVQVAIETASTVADIIGGVDADLTLTASPSSLSVGQSSTLTARLTVFGVDEICGVGGTLGAQFLAQKLGDRILSKLLFSNTGVSLVRRAFELLGVDFLNTFLTNLRNATTTLITETGLGKALSAAANALCPAGGLCNPLINTRAALTGPNASLVSPLPDGSARFTCPPRTPTSPTLYAFTAERNFCGEPVKAEAEVACATGRVTITMGDNGNLLDDIYEVQVDGVTVLTSSVPVRSISTTIELPVGRHVVTMIGRAAPDGVGTYFITFSGARLISGDPTSGTDLTPGVVKTFIIEVQ